MSDPALKNHSQLDPPPPRALTKESLLTHACQPVEFQWQTDLKVRWLCETDAGGWNTKKIPEAIFEKNSVNTS